jgi:hypothetical protein
MLVDPHTEPGAPGQACQREDLASPQTAGSSTDKMEGPPVTRVIGILPFSREGQ